MTANVLLMIVMMTAKDDGEMLGLELPAEERGGGGEAGSYAG